MNKKPDEIFCPYCGDSIKKQAEICPSCGVRNRQDALPDSQLMHCFSCGEEIRTAAEICPSCGVKNTPPHSGSTTTKNPSFSGDRRKIVRITTTGLGILLIIASIGALSEGELSVGVPYALIGMALLPQVRDRISIEYPLSTIGYVSSVDETDLAESGKPCTVCQKPVEKGKQRVYTKKFVFLGIPIQTVDEGANPYCSSCLLEEGSDMKTADEIEKERTSR